jgi:hypothetical protein
MTASGGPGHARAGLGVDLWPERQFPEHSERLALVDLLDRVLAGGVVLAGDVTLSIAGIDLVRVSLRALVASVSALASSSGVLEQAE